MTESADVEATRAAYDATAGVYAERIGTEISRDIEDAVDLRMLADFAERAGAGTHGVVADVGCGPGRVAGLLAGAGLDAVGIDLSASMLDLARTAHPGVDLVQASILALPIASHSVAAAVSWYSIIHTPPGQLGAALDELLRIVVPGGPVLLGFQAGAGEAVHRSEVQGHRVSLTAYRHDPDQVVALLEAVGATVEERVVRGPWADHESTDQAFIAARTRRSA